MGFNPRLPVRGSNEQSKEMADVQRQDLVGIQQCEESRNSAT
jgi:hypothetical protein